MPHKYRRALLPSLTERLDQLLNSETHAEQLQLYEEIALSRAMLERTLTLTDVALGSETISPETKLLAIAAAREGMAHVADLCAKMARIEKDMGDRITVRQLGAFVTQVGQQIHAVLGDDPRIEDIARRISDGVKMLPDESQAKVDVQVTFEE